MILTTILNSFRKRNWTNFIIELGVVFIGIFAALQADNWNQNRLDRQRVSNQLERIDEDSILLRSRLQRILGAYDQRTSRFKTIFEILDGEPLSDENIDDFEILLSSSYQIYDPSAQIPGLNQLINSGDINLINDANLRSKLLDFANSRSRQDLINEHLRELLNMNFRAYFDAVTYDISEVKPELNRGASFQVRYDIDELRNDRLFRNSIGNVALMHTWWRNNTAIEIDRLEEVILLLDSQ